jgi:hypothetical protein
MTGIPVTRRRHRCYHQAMKKEDEERIAARLAKVINPIN